MADHFKKQVMFLHPEPSLMAPCVDMLGEEFSVHMATSGTEALTTLGITPIDIIVSAQDLPGMTGQEALREAKKRSPETRGILIANASMSAADRAALVNVRHLNQILNAGSTVSEICAAIHHELSGEATQSLPQPANDFSAGPRDGHARTGSYKTGAFRNSDTFASEQIPDLVPSEGGAPSAQSLSEVELVVLTNDGSFLKTIRAATGNSHVVNHAPNLQEAVDIVREGRSGVLITDAAVAVKDVETITAKLRKYMPSLVTIVAGRREDGEKMMGLISDGLVYRFLLKPISPGRSRLAIEASAKKHLTLVSTDVPLTPRDVEEKMTETGIIKGVTFDSGLFRTTDVRESNVSLPTLDDDMHEVGLLTRISDTLRAVPPLVLAAVAVVLTLLIVFATRDSAPEASAPALSPEPAARQAPVQARDVPEVSRAERYERAMQRARAAMAEDRLTTPADDNAIVHYAQAAALRRDDASARNALDSALQTVFADIESALLADNLQQAGAALAVLNAHVPGHPRLAFFNRQFAKESARRDLASIEALLANGETDAAESILGRLRASDSVDAAVLAALEQRVAQASDANGVTQLMQLASQRVAEGRLVAPEADNARHYYNAALDADPGNQLAREGLDFVAAQLLQRAADRIAIGDLAGAEIALANAESTGANAIEVELTRRRLEQAQATARTSSRPARTEPARQQQTPPTQQPDAETRNESAAAASAREDTAVPPPPASITARADDAADAGDRRRAAVTDDATPSKPADTAAAKPVATQAAAPIELKQRRYVAPEYPRTAMRRGVEGWADVEFVVLADGTTSDVRIAESAPGTIFDRAAIVAVSQWAYEPLSTTDPAVTEKARVRLEFDLSE